jgi:DNA (cytosine-5)-methyltransferase 1
MNGGKRPVAIDLFCGCGGTTLGLKMAGYDVAVGVDESVPAIAVYRDNNRSTVGLARDIRTVSSLEIQDLLGNQRVDLLAGCPPCQGFSKIRTRNARLAAKDPRNSLYLEMLRLADGLRPRAVLMENVASFHESSQFFRFVREIKKLGYSVSSGVINAADFGIPQRRHRFVLIAALNVKDLREVAAWEFHSPKQVTVEDALRGLSAEFLSTDPLHQLGHRVSPKVKKIIENVPKNGGNRPGRQSELTLDCHVRSNGFRDVYGRMAWDKVAPTITAGIYSPSKGRYLHPEENRCISLREAAILQGFPKDYRFNILHGKIKIASMIGNAMPPGLAEIHAKILREEICNGIV